MVAPGASWVTDVSDRQLPWFRRVQAKALAWILVACALLAAMAVVWIVQSAQVRTDHIAGDREERLAANGFKLRTREVQKAVVTETVWDDAVRNLDLRLDRRWAEANMMTFFAETSGYELVSVLDAGGRPVLGHMPGSDSQVWPQIRGDVDRMVASIRLREAQVKRGAAGLPSKTLISQPIDATTVVRIGGTPYVLVAALVQPDFGTVLPHRPAPIVVVGDAMDEAFLKSFGQAFLLDGVRLTALSAKSTPGSSVLPIQDMQGKVVVQLGWTPESPAGDLIKHLSAPIGALAVVLILMPGSLFLWERRRAAQLQARINERDAAFTELRTAMASMVELREHNARQKVLLDELNHRVKNSLASVQSIARQTLKGVADLDEFSRTFEARLLALSQTHELLVNGKWMSVSLSSLARQHLDHYGRRYTIEGEDLLLSPNYAMSLGLAFHELATNALKYGAWSTGERGLVTVKVREAGEYFELTWTEMGGPEVLPPKRKGFGSRLLQSVGREFGGDVTMDYRPSGLVCLIRISHSDSVTPLGAVEQHAHHG